MLSHATGSIIERVLDKEAEPIDLYYGDKKDTRVSSVPTVQRTNAVFSLSSANLGGSASVYVSPDQGISNIMMGLKLPGTSAYSYLGGAVPRAWGYNAINFVQMRIGNSSLFQWSGRQLMLMAIRSASSAYVADQLMNLAGQASFYNTDGSSSIDTTPGLPGINPFANDSFRWAYVNIPMPWCGNETDRRPLKTELLSSPVQIIVNLKAVSDIIAVAPGGTAVSAGTGWEQAFLQVKQVQVVGDKRPAKPDVYALEATFTQQENVAVATQAVATVQQELALLGFRNGSIQELDLYMLADSTDMKANPFDYVLPYDVNIIYMGNQIHTFPGFSSQYWSRVYSEVPASFENIRYTQAVSTANPALTSWIATAIKTSWVMVPFSGLRTHLDAEEPVSQSGLAVQNGIINLQLKTGLSETAKVYYHADLQSAIVFHSGTADYAF